MNGSNEILEDEDLRAALVAQHPQLVRVRFDGFAADMASPKFYFTRNLPLEYSLTTDYLNTHSWDNGSILTNADVKGAVYGPYDGPFESDLLHWVRLMFTDRSDYNRSLTSGYTFLCDPATGVVSRLSVFDVGRHLQAKAFGRTLDTMASEARKGRDRNNRSISAVDKLLDGITGPEADALRAELGDGALRFGGEIIDAVRKVLGAIGPGPTPSDDE
jgi:hypothetical protein